jgi:hypothetical protein
MIHFNRTFIDLRIIWIITKQEIINVAKEIVSSPKQNNYSDNSEDSSDNLITKGENQHTHTQN